MIDPRWQVLLIEAESLLAQQTGVSLDEAHRELLDVAEAGLHLLRTRDPSTALALVVELLDLVHVAAPIFRRDSSRVRAKARAAHAAGDLERARRLRAKAARIEDRQGLPHPGEG